MQSKKLHGGVTGFDVLGLITILISYCNRIERVKEVSALDLNCENFIY